MKRAQNYQNPMNFSNNQSQEKKKKVLLACIYNKKGFLFTHDIFYRLFSQYG